MKGVMIIVFLQFLVKTNANPMTVIELKKAPVLSPIKDRQLNDRPIIAIIAQRHPRGSNQSYIAASYVKYLESAGARVVPIPHYFTKENITQIFPYLNGVLYPGGGITWFTSDYYKNAKVFWDLAIQANDKGNFFPVWGTCLGFEALHMIRAGEYILSVRKANDKALPLNFTKEAKTSRLFKDAPSEVMTIFANENVTWNHHGKGMTRETYAEKEYFNKFFKILSFNLDVNNKEFISTVEAYEYPIYGVQWHPEKNNFEFNTLYNEQPHTVNAVKVSQYMANFFVNEARKSLQKFPSQEMESKYLIYNYIPTHSSQTDQLRAFEQVYYFQG